MHQWFRKINDCGKCFGTLPISNVPSVVDKGPVYPHHGTKRANNSACFPSVIQNFITKPLPVPEFLSLSAQTGSRGLFYISSSLPGQTGAHGS